MWDSPTDIGPGTIEGERDKPARGAEPTKQPLQGTIHTPPGPKILCITSNHNCLTEPVDSSTVVTDTQSGIGDGLIGM